MRRAIGACEKAHRRCVPVLGLVGDKPAWFVKHDGEPTKPAMQWIIHAGDGDLCDRVYFHAGGGSQFAVHKDFSCGDEPVSLPSGTHVAPRHEFVDADGCRLGQALVGRGCISIAAKNPMSQAQSWVGQWAAEQGGGALHVDWGTPARLQCYVWGGLTLEGEVMHG